MVIFGLKGSLNFSCSGRILETTKYFGTLFMQIQNLIHIIYFKMEVNYGNESDSM